MPPDVMKVALDAIPAEIEYHKALVEEGKITAKYAFVGKSEGIAIFDVESNEELNEILAKSPSSLMLSFEAIPLIDFEYAIKKWKEIVKRAFK